MTKNHGQESKDAQGKRKISATLRGKLIAEARRLGASPDWKPEDVDANGKR